MCTYIHIYIPHNTDATGTEDTLLNRHRRRRKVLGRPDALLCLRVSACGQLARVYRAQALAGKTLVDPLHVHGTHSYGKPAQKIRRLARRRSQQHELKLLRCQYLCFCTSKASKLSTFFGSCPGCMPFDSTIVPPSARIQVSVFARLYY